MKKGICNLSVVPVRENPSEKSEMVNELLFGEAVEIDDWFEEWYYIRSDNDGYHGWINKQQIILLNDDVFGKYLQSEKSYVISEIAVIENQQGEKLYLSMGSTLASSFGKEFSALNYHLQFGETALAKKQPVERLLELARKYLNVPYRWGGRSFFGIDCSGFTQIVFKMCGYDLPRDSTQQAKTGEAQYLIDEAHAGDLLFFGNQEQMITHVGILLDKEHLIHASGKVRIDKIDHFGIFNNNLQNYTHQLRAIQKIL